MRNAGRRLPFVLAALVSPALLLSSCQKAPPPDPICTYEPLPEGSRVPAGQGAIQAAAPASDYFYVLDTKGKELGHARTDRSVAVKPGEYRVKLNGSTHPVWAKAKTLTRCVCGALLVSGTTDEYYYVVDAGGTELAHAKMNNALSLFPGGYVVKLNGTTEPADVPSGGTREVKSGTLQVQGATDEYYYALGGTGAELAHNKLGRPLAFVAGAITVKVNGTTMPAKVEAGKTSDVMTGTLTATGGAGYYYVLDATTGAELAHAKAGRPVALAPGTYSVRLDKETRPVVVAEGQAVVSAFSP